MPDANEIIKKLQFNHQKTEFANEEKESLSKWVTRLASELRYARNVVVKDSEIQYFIESLEKANYEDWRRPLAEVWITRGNWNYKKQNRLLFQDFYPEAKSMENLINSFVFIEDFKILIEKIESFYDTKLQMIKKEFEMRLQEEILKTNQNRMVSDLFNQIFNLTMENARIEKNKNKYPLETEA